MKTQTIILLTIVMLSISFLTYPANAESGTIVISDDKTFDFTKDTVTCTTNCYMNFSIITFDINNYNYISSFSLKPTNFPTGTLQWNSTRFTIISGGTGGGYHWYDLNWSKIYYSFDSSDTFTSSPIIISLESDIWSGASMPTTITSYTDHTVSSTQPVMIKSDRAVGSGAGIYSETVSLRQTDSYNISYLSNNLFSVSVNKGDSVSSKYIIHGSNTIYSTETTFNKIDINNAIYTYADGLYLNATLESGVYADILVNGSGISGYVPPGEELIPDPITGVGIQFNSATYSQNDIANISWIRTINTPFACNDYVRAIMPDGQAGDLVRAPPNSGYTKQVLDQIGTYQVSFERECFLGGTEILDSDSATVSGDDASYILAKSPQGAGIPFNVMYLFGYTPAVQGELNSIVVEKLTGDIWEWNNAFSLNNTAIVKNTEYNKSVVLGDIGKYKIKLFELSKGYVAEVIVDSIAVTIPTVKNITTSIITVDKTEYLTSDYITVYYAIDNYNYSNYFNKYISIIHSSGSYPETSHILVTEQENTINYMDSNSILQNAHKGINYVQLRAKNNTADILLTNISFNISFVDSNGYGLDVVNPSVCQNEYIVIKYATPTNATLRINTAKDNEVPIKFFEVSVSGTGSIKVKLTKNSDYQILLYGAGVQDVIKVTTATTLNCAIPTPVTTYKGINGTWTPTNENIKETCSYWDTWVRGIFGVQGVNDVSRILLALGTIVAMMFIGLIASKGNFGVAIILGFFPYAFFTYLTLSTPCGQYLPLWINIFIALIIGIKMRWFS